MATTFELWQTSSPTGFGQAETSLATFSGLKRTFSTADAQLSEETYDQMVQCLVGSRTRPIFLWMIRITLEIKAPLHWWKQADAYFDTIQWIRNEETDAEGIRRLLPSHFEDPIPAGLLELLNQYAQNQEREKLRRLLPDSHIRRGYLQTNYLVLRQSFLERAHYQSGHWKRYCESLRTLPYNRLLTEGGRANL